jgi:hypothetical protein
MTSRKLLAFGTEGHGLRAGSVQIRKPCAERTLRWDQDRGSTEPRAPTRIGSALSPFAES